MSLHLYDSATAKVRPFVPLQEGHARIYLCGATVQGQPHIGHIRSALAFDVLIRWLKATGLRVTFVRNVTDIDDKILAKSAEAGQPWWAWATICERAFTSAYEALGVLPPTVEPRATGHISCMIALTQRLFDNGHAYTTTPGNVYFSVRSLPDYGSLTRQNLDELTSTEDPTQDDGPGQKRDPRDFALWKAPKPTEPETASWDTPWGRARPGWHLECSAMSHRYLGESFDIHGGGLDLRFPHHENEQAQSHGAGWGFANLWMHNAWVTMRGEKMSKSLGNSLLVSTILSENDPAVVRFALATVHYRSMLDYGPETLAEAAAQWERLRGFCTRAAEFLGADGGQTALPDTDSPMGVTVQATAPGDLPTAQNWPTLADMPAEFTQAMNDDLNVAGALAVLHEHLKGGNTALAASDAAAVSTELRYVRAMLAVLGLDPFSQPWAGAAGSNTGASAGGASLSSALNSLVESALTERATARAAKDWARADAVRDQLAAAGVIVEDGAGGVRWHLKEN